MSLLASGPLGHRRPGSTAEICHSGSSREAAPSTPGLGANGLPRHSSGKVGSLAIRRNVLEMREGLPQSLQTTPLSSRTAIRSGTRSRNPDHSGALEKNMSISAPERHTYYMSRMLDRPFPGVPAAVRVYPSA
jgi:hypothetical protein